MITIILLSFLCISTVFAKPGRAATCISGNPIYESPHNHGGTLNDGGIIFRIDGEFIHNYPNGNSVIELNPGVYNFMISAPSLQGFLIRLSSSSGINTRNKFIFSSEVAQHQGSCDFNVAGITHTSLAIHSSISLTFDGNESGDYILDMTVGRADGVWPVLFYNQFLLRVPTTIQTVSPTGFISSTPDPTAKPTVKPSFIPSREPSSIPSIKPLIESTYPSLIPTTIPDVFTDEPSSMNSSVPTMYPSQNPFVVSFHPSIVPSAHPSNLHPTFQPTLTPTATSSIPPSNFPANTEFELVDPTSAASYSKNGFLYSSYKMILLLVILFVMYIE